jgi:acetyl-CoA carboxylase carboxyltransferase component
MGYNSNKIKEHAEEIYDSIYSEIEEKLSYDISEAIDDEKIMDIAMRLADDAYYDAMETRAELIREMRMDVEL